MFLSVRDADKPAATMLAALLQSLGFELVATSGTARALQRIGIPVRRVAKVTEGSPNVVDLIRAGEIDLVINTPAGRGARTDGYEIRAAAIAHGIPCITTLAGRVGGGAGDLPGAARWTPPALQDIHRGEVAGAARCTGVACA